VELAIYWHFDLFRRCFALLELEIQPGGVQLGGFVFRWPFAPLPGLCVASGTFKGKGTRTRPYGNLALAPLAVSRLVGTLFGDHRDDLRHIFLNPPVSFSCVSNTYLH